MGVRDVQAASGVIAGEENSTEFYISPSRLSQIENDGSEPGLHKLFSLAAIYGLDLVELLCRYGINPDRIHHYREYLKLDSTHPVNLDVHNPSTTATIPVRFDPSFRWDSTQLLNRVVAQWGKIPAVLLQELNPRTEMYGYVGLSDFTMYPVLRPGALVLIDGSRRRVVHTGWANEAERPIYFIELRDGYRCAWCQVDGNRLTLVPHPMSAVAAETFRFPDEAEVAGQVVGVAMRIVKAENPQAASEQSFRGRP